MTHRSRNKIPPLIKIGRKDISRDYLSAPCKWKTPTRYSYQGLFTQNTGVGGTLMGMSPSRFRAYDSWSPGIGPGVGLGRFPSATPDSVP